MYTSIAHWFGCWSATMASMSESSMSLPTSRNLLHYKETQLITHTLLLTYRLSLLHTILHTWQSPYRVGIRIVLAEFSLVLNYRLQVRELVTNLIRQNHFVTKLQYCKSYLKNLIQLFLVLHHCNISFTILQNVVTILWTYINGYASGSSPNDSQFSNSPILILLHTQQKLLPD